MPTTRVLCLLGLLAVLGICAVMVRSGGRDVNTVHALDPDVRKLLSGRVIPEFNLGKASLDQAIVIINAEFQKDAVLRRYRVAKWTQVLLPESI